MDKYGVGDDPTCYPGTSVLRNKFNIQDQKILDEAEAEYTSIAIKKITFKEPPYTLDVWMSIHGTLFSDIYPWAGSLRTVDISKQDTRFCNAGQIMSYANQKFQELEKEEWLTNLSFDDLIDRISYYFSEFNLVHPFREGNGRTQRLFFDSILLNCGYMAKWQLVDPKEWIQANIDAYNCNYEKMKLIFRGILINLIN